jgi:hypothetical protein
VAHGRVQAHQSGQSCCHGTFLQRPISLIYRKSRDVCMVKNLCSLMQLENWALCVVHYKPIRGKNGNNVEQVEDKRSSTNKSSTGSLSEAVGSPSQNLMVGSSYESNPHISCGSNNFNVASSSYPQGTSSCPQPFQTLCNPNKRQQCSISCDQPLYITCMP